MLIFHIKTSSSKWNSGDVKPNFGKPAEIFPLQCKNCFLKRQKNKKKLFSFGKLFVLNELFWPHLEGSLANLPKVFLRITARKFNSFHEIIFYRKFPLSSFKVAVTRLSKNICRSSKDFYWTTGDTYDTMISFRRKTSLRFYCGQAECSCDKLAKRLSLESKFCSLPIWRNSETVNPDRTKNFYKGKTSRHVECICDNPAENVQLEVRNIFTQNWKKSWKEQCFSKKK